MGSGACIAIGRADTICNYKLTEGCLARIDMAQHSDIDVPHSICCIHRCFMSASIGAVNDELAASHATVQLCY